MTGTVKPALASYYEVSVLAIIVFLIWFLCFHHSAGDCILINDLVFD